MLPDQIGCGLDKDVSRRDGGIGKNQIADDNPEKCEIDGQAAPKRRAPKFEKIDDKCWEIFHARTVLPCKAVL